MPFSSVEEFERTESPTEAECALIAACQNGMPCVFPYGTAPGQATLPPEGPAPENRRIRAALLRLFILGGTPACALHPSGVWLEGAHITGTLDLRFAKAVGQCTLQACRFDEAPQLSQATIPELSLSKSYVPGMFAQELIVTGSVFLRGLISTGLVLLRGAKITGQLDFNGANLDGSLDTNRNQLPCLYAQGVEVGDTVFLNVRIAKGMVDLAGCKIKGQFACDRAILDGGKDSYGNQHRSLYAQNAQIGAAVFLRGITAIGTVDLNGAIIAGQLACDGAKLDGGQGANGVQQKSLNAQGVQVGGDLLLPDINSLGTIYLNGAKVTGDTVCVRATLNGGKSANGTQQFSLNAQNLRVSQGFIFRQMNSVTGQVYLDAAHVGNLVDDADSWPKAQDQLYLNGFTYDRIASGPLTLAERQTWLANGSRFKDTFHPQPYTQFARVLREAGHASEARKVLMQRDNLLFAESHKANLAALNAARRGDGRDVGTAWLRHKLLRFWDWFSFTASGYGHAPQRALYLSLACIGGGALWFFLAWQAGVMVPNSAIILTSPDWRAAMASNPNAPSADWAKLPSGKHYETFYALPYALDVFVPFVSLGQEQAWAATTVTWPGIFTRWFTFAYQIAGWSLTALGIASITGLVQKNQPD